MRFKRKGYITEVSVTRSEAGQFTLLYDPKKVIEVERATRLSDRAQQRARRG